MAVEDNKFLFVQVHSPNGVKNGRSRRVSRSHAIKQALENKRKYQQKSGNNFQIVLKEDFHESAVTPKLQRSVLESKPFPLFADSADAFQSLASDSSRLQVWLNHCYNLGRPSESDFTISDELVLQNFPSIFRNSLDDPALLNAAMLTFAFAVTGAINQECLKYLNQALNSIRVRMSSPERAASEATLAAILLLARIEARLDMPFKVQLHMNAVQQLLNICESRGVILSNGIKRAIFWQDLNSSIMTGSSRIVDHTTFAELQWTRDTFTPDIFIIPPGFEKTAHMLTPTFISVLKDMHALQSIRDSGCTAADDILFMAQIDNHQASIQSRLANSPKGPPFMDSCCHATYLCSAMLRCRIWRNSVTPSYLSLKLLRTLQKVNDDPVWDTYPEVLIWLLHIGGAFAPIGEIRSHYVSLMQMNHASRFKGRYASWPQLLEILSQFIWSETAFQAQVKGFWEETYQLFTIGI